jgi:hypothetical protein
MAYRKAKMALAELLAYERGEKVTVSHRNEATEILWPLLSDATRSLLVLR